MESIFGGKKETIKEMVVEFIKNKLEGFNPDIEFSEEKEGGVFLVIISNTDEQTHDSFWDRFEEVFDGAEEDEEVTSFILSELFKDKESGLHAITAEYRGENIECSLFKR